MRESRKKKQAAPDKRRGSLEDYGERRGAPMRKGSKQGARIDGQAVQKLDKPLAEVAEEFIKIKESTGRAPQTIRTYRYQLQYFLEYAGEDVKCSELTLDKLTGYLDNLRGRGITNPVTLNTAIQNLSPVVHYARERGYSVSFGRFSSPNSPYYSSARRRNPAGKFVIKA